MNSNRRRAVATIQVTWDLDPVPGWNHESADVVSALLRRVGPDVVGDHYNPTVTLVSVTEDAQ